SAPSYDDLTSVLESSTIDPQLLTPASPNASDDLSSTPSSITSLDMSGFLSIEADKALLGEVDELIRFIPQPTTESLSQTDLSTTSVDHSPPYWWQPTPQLPQEVSPHYSLEELWRDYPGVTFESQQARPHETLPFIPAVNNLQQAAHSSGSTSPNSNGLLDYININDDGTRYCAYPG
ncbi:MAG: hypothetical protein M1830_004503, partial [Pleopsidium flavum]